VGRVDVALRHQVVYQLMTNISMLQSSFSRVWRPFMLSRLWVALWVYAGHWQNPYRAEGAATYSGVENWWLNPWTTFDTQWFLRIARYGYEPETATFFPLYPFLLRLAGDNENSMALWGVLLSSGAFLCMLAALHQLTTLDYGEDAATSAVWLLGFWPLSAVFSAVYTDALFGALLVTAFLFARRERWAAAGIFAALAALTRNAGPVIFVALLLQWLMAVRVASSTQSDEGETATARPAPVSIVFVFLPLLAFLGVQFYVASQVGGLTGVTGHERFGRALMWPWLPLWRDIVNLLTLHDSRLTTLLGVAVTLGVFVLAWKHRRSQPIPYAVLMLGVMMMQLTFGRTTAPYTNSSLRFMSTSFPFVQLLGVEAAPLLKNRFRLILVTAIYLLIGAVISMYFGQRQFVMG
jgi:hypothetical protein